MTPERWQRIEELFSLAQAQDPDQISEFVRANCGSDTDLAAEVLSLLRYGEANSALLVPGQFLLARQIVDLTLTKDPGEPSSTTVMRGEANREASSGDRTFTATQGQVKATPVLSGANQAPDKPSGEHAAAERVDVPTSTRPADTRDSRYPVDLRPGDWVGPYRLVRPLGTGGMAEVWLAKRADGVQEREVALKIPHAQWADRGLVERMQRERAVLASLNHPGIAHLYDAGVADSGRPYLALEVVHGEPIGRHCAARGLNVRERIRLFIDVLRAVAYAHARLVVHRDLKPANVFVTAEGQVKLLDFGIAKVLASDTQPAEATELTRLSGRPLTLAYAAPEQITNQAVTTATDTYSLGAMLYELLSGRRPYSAGTNSLAGLEEAILRSNPALPSSLAEEPATRRGLRGDLDSIILKALQRNPDQRYETAAAFADDLERHLAGRAVHARRASRWYRLQRFVNRNRLAISAATAVAVSLVVGLGTAIWQAGEARQQAALATKAAQIALEERNHAIAAADHWEAVNRFMSNLLEEAGRTGKPISIEGLIARADEMSAVEFANNPEPRAAVLNSVGTFVYDHEGAALALPYFDKAEALLRSSQDVDLKASVGCAKAALLGASGNMKEAGERIEEILRDPRLQGYFAIECLIEKAELARYRGDGPAAAQIVERAVKQWNTSASGSPMQHVELKTLGAQVKSLNGLPGDADQDYEQSLVELKRLGLDRGSRGTQVRMERMFGAIASGDVRLALSLTDEAISILRQDMPDHRPPLLLVYERCAMLDQLGQYEEALAGYRNLVPFAAASDPVIEQRSLFDMATLLSRLGRFEQAEEQYRVAVRISDPSLAALGPSGQIPRLLARARLDIDSGHFSAGRQHLTEALQIDGAAKSTLATLRRLRATARLGEGDLTGARDDGIEAVRLSEALRGDKPYSTWVGQSKLVLGKVMRAQGDFAQARKLLASALDQFMGSVGAEHALTQEAKANQIAG